MVIKKRDFKRGYHFKNLKGAPAADVLETNLPAQIVIALKQSNGEILAPLVKTEDYVKAGQIIVRDDKVFGSPIHAPVSGEIIETKKITYFGERKVPALVIRPDDNQEETLLNGYSPEWQSLSREKIEELLYLSGTAGLGNSGIPTAYNSSVIGPSEVNEVIVHHSESDLWEPLLPALLQDRKTGRENLDAFVQGAAILRKVFPNAGISFVVSNRYKEIIDKLDQSLGGDIKLFPAAVKYPQGMEQLLVRTVLDRDFPNGFKAINMGIVILDVQAVLHAYEAVTAGRSVTERTVALAGPGFRENVHLRVKIGVPLSNIVKNYGAGDEKQYRYIRNSALRGDKIDDITIPLDRTIHTLVALREAEEGEPLAFALPGFRKDSISRTFFSLFTPFKKNIDTNLRGEKRACINCGFCVEVCPAGILPNVLHRHVERSMITETLVRFGLFSCIDCNLCTYVCTSKIPLASLLKEGKELLIKEGLTEDERMIMEFELKGVGK